MGRNVEAWKTSRLGEWRLVALTLPGLAFLYGVCLVMLAGGGWLMWHAHVVHSGYCAAFRLGLPVVILGLAGFWVLFTVRPRRHQRRFLCRKDAPLLWAMVDDLGKVLNTLRGIIEKNRAALRHEAGKRQCAPFFLRREQGRWRFGLAAMSRHVMFAARGQWPFRAGLAGPHAFGFKAWNVDRSGYPHPPQERS